MTVGGWSDSVGIVVNRAQARVSSRIEYLTFFSAFFLLLLILGASLFTPARAQDAKLGIAGLGDLVVTGASGTLPPPANPPLPPGVNELDETFIDPNGASLKVFDVRNPGGPPEAQLLNAPTKFQAFARDIGQVFGLALDKSNPPNIFAASTSVHGLHIVVPDADGDGRPERIKLGQPGAGWMNGQFGAAKGGGPGTVWKINGETGEITKFADILSGGVPNSGAGLGNIAYDAKRKQLFVTDLDTGLIHRLDMTGTDLGTFDHGLQGRPANGMNAVPMDAANRLDIASPAFDAEDSSSWGMAAPERRTWGVAIRGDRLYYSVEAGPQIWSIGINTDGSFGGDPRWELDVPADPNAYPVSDIAFTSSGQMLLAQRGGIASRYDYSQYQTPRKTRVLRYSLESPDDVATPSRWAAEPEDYAIGFPGIHRNTSGGIAIGYGYTRKSDGSYGFGSCEGTLWSTGDALRDNPIHGAKLAQGGPLNVHGLQGNALSLVKPQNVPPWASYYVDFDGQFDDPQASGHVGDVEIPYSCKKPDLRVLKRAKAERCDAGGRCVFEVEIENVGEVPYEGPLVITDIADGGAALVGHSPPPPPPGWDCKEQIEGVPGVYECSYPETTLAPGEKITLEMTFQIPDWWDRNVYKNCVELTTPGFAEDEYDYNNESCDYVPMVEPGHPHYRPDLQLEKFNLDWNCDWFGICRFVVRVTNVGSADYTGPLHIHDVTTTPGAVLTHFEPDPPWNCGPLGGDAFDCTHPPVTLSPGEFREVIIWVQGPPLGLGHTFVRNCARIDWDGRPRDFNRGNEYACTDTSRYPPGHPDARARLGVEKDAFTTCFPGAGPGGGWLCYFRVRITNTGGAPYFGPFEVADNGFLWAAGGAGILQAIADPPWTCAPGIGGGVPQTCTRPPIPGGLQPGETHRLYLDFEVPAAIATPDALVNCARIAHDNDGDGVPEDIEDCAVAPICTPGPGGDCPQDLAVDKWGDHECWPGFPCNFSIEVRNLGTVQQPAGLVITDVPNPDAGAFTKIWPVGPSITCAPAGTNQTCTVNFPIPAGGGFNLEFALDVPAAYPWTTLKNCASIAPSVFNMFGFNNEDCDTAYIPGPDLAPHGGTECTLGVPCPLDVTIDNTGLRPFKGATGLKGTLSPAVPITSISSQTSGLTCSVTGNGTYQCNANNLTLAPGASAKLQLTILVPKSFKGTRISHIKNMVWPDRKVKDRNPKNDQHISIITIEQPKEPVPPPTPPAGQPDLAVTKTARSSTCIPGQPCGFSVKISNVSTSTFTGPLKFTDTITPSNATLSYAGPPPWSCGGGGGTLTCTHPGTTLAPGASKTLSLIFTAPQSQYRTGTLQNCAALSWGAAGGSSILAVQQALLAQGLNPGRPDGRMGANTRRAIREYQKRHGLPVTGRINSALIASLLGGGGDSNPANDRDCASAGLRAVTPTPEPLSCPSGYTPYKNKYQVPKGWQVITRQSGNLFLYCAKPPALSCPSGYKPYNNRNQVPKGWQVITRRSGNVVLYCAKPPAVSCPSGWSRVDPVKAAVLASQGYQIKTVGSIICARPPALRCPSGWNKVSRSKAKTLVRQGYQIKQIGKGSLSIMCAKPPSVSCPSGWRKVSRNKAKSLARQGYQIKQVGNILCARPGKKPDSSITTPPPSGQSEIETPPPSAPPMITRPSTSPTLKIDPNLLKQLQKFKKLQ